VKAGVRQIFLAHLTWRWVTAYVHKPQKRLLKKRGNRKGRHFQPNQPVRGRQEFLPHPFAQFLKISLAIPLGDDHSREEVNPEPSLMSEFLGGPEPSACYRIREPN
jgi:hypothetical protein